MRGLLGAFPDLRDSFDPDELPVSFIIARGSGRLTPTKRQPGRGRRSTLARGTAMPRREGASQAADTATAAPPSRRKPMSAAARKAVSERMTAYWAARRKAKKK
jgi:hypothetical protein